MNIETWERNYRSSRSQIFFKIGVLKNFANFTGKHLCKNLFLTKLQIWRLANLLRKDSNTRSSCSHMFFQKGVFKNFENFTGKYLCWSLFLIKFQAWRPAISLRRDSNTGVFLWNLRKFQEHLFYRTTPVATFETKHIFQLPIYYILE